MALVHHRRALSNSVIAILLGPNAPANEMRGTFETVKRVSSDRAWLRQLSKNNKSIKISKFANSCSEHMQQGKTEASFLPSAVWETLIAAGDQTRFRKPHKFVHFSSSPASI